MENEPLNLQQKLEALYGLRLHAPRSSLDDRSDYLTLLARLGNPHLHMPPAIHVAGTNGKGSTIATLRAMYEAEGYKVHVYTSPHLVRFHERIVLAGREIDDQALEAFLDETLAHTADLQLTFFEIVTSMAFLAFARTPADLSLIETGLGGRIDCTNVIQKPLATIITRISLDHCQYLGETIQEIAAEKAGIMKSGVPCVIGYQGALSSHDSETLPFDSIAGQIDTPLHRADQEWSVDKSESDPSHFMFRYGSLQQKYPVPSLVGAHQLENAGAALACSYLIDSLPIQDESRKTGLNRIRWPGRLQRLDNHPLQKLLPSSWELWLDGGHNDSAGQMLAHQAAQWHAQDARALHLIMGMKRDKDARSFLNPLLPHLASITIIRIPGFDDQSHDPETLALFLQKKTQALKIRAAPDLASALKNLTLIRKGRLLIAGSLFLSGYVLDPENFSH